MYWSASGWYLKAWQTQTITAWRTWISWVFLLTLWTTALLSSQQPLQVLKALQLTGLIAQVSKVIHHYYAIICLFGDAVICHPAQWKKRLLIQTDTKKLPTFLHVPIFILPQHCWMWSRYEGLDLNSWQTWFRYINTIKALIILTKAAFQIYSVRKYCNSHYYKLMFC